METNSRKGTEKGRVEPEGGSEDDHSRPRKVEDLGCEGPTCHEARGG